MSDENKVVYDAENDVENINNTSDSVKEITEELEDAVDKSSGMIYDAENADETNNEQPEQENYEMDENQQNVFENGLNGGEFIRIHSCPMCMVGKKSISELYVKKRFSRKKKIVGYASICANCGHVSFYATNIDDLLSFFKGKVTL